MIDLISSLLYHLYAHIQAKPLGRKTRHTVETWEFLFKAIIVASNLKIQNMFRSYRILFICITELFFPYCLPFMLHVHAFLAPSSNSISISELAQTQNWILHRDYCFLMRLGKGRPPAIIIAIRPAASVIVVIRQDRNHLHLHSTQTYRFDQNQLWSL